MKTVNRNWWYKQLFFKLCFRAKYNLKPKRYIVFIWLSLYSTFFFLFTFQCFSSVYFLLFCRAFCTSPHEQEKHDMKQTPLQYYVNIRLLESSVNLKKTLSLACALRTLSLWAISWKYWNFLLYMQRS